MKVGLYSAIIVYEGCSSHTLQSNLKTTKSGAEAYLSRVLQVTQENKA